MRTMKNYDSFEIEIEKKTKRKEINNKNTNIKDG